jgi:hypothetical protein
LYRLKAQINAVIAAINNNDAMTITAIAHPGNFLLLLSELVVAGVDEPVNVGLELIVVVDGVVAVVLREISLSRRLYKDD